jgi:hypothetical protein
MAYTDGSQKKVPLLGQEEHEITVIGSGIYLPAKPQTEEQHIGVRATQNGHNTAYRADTMTNELSRPVHSLSSRVGAMSHRPRTALDSRSRRASTGGSQPNGRKLLGTRQALLASRE